MSPHFWQRNQFFFFNDTATTEIYTLSLHDALPIWLHRRRLHAHGVGAPGAEICDSRPTAVLADSDWAYGGDRKSTRLSSSHSQISYAVFCLKKKNKNSPSTLFS